MYIVTRIFDDEKDDSCIGILEQDGKLICWTLERISTIIPVGTYDLISTFSPHFNQDMPLVVVPGRDGIRIHWANYPTQLEGCTALGILRNQPGIGDVGNSRDAFNLFLSTMHLPDKITYQEAI
jgi:hypothetical protein